jgi:hypothetical protein
MYKENIANTNNISKNLIYFKINEYYLIISQKNP